ncbi:putative U-box domain protein [Trypanosoma theileri]|uniref:Putative U-box domain protein n=1 Tax=Trypanosoma theileri TaxID=67003 RepID=A0A1X0NZM7_9TRYP|nr:putative U-box domain protein [Trypanosoma theileri]ORC90135.1 putative U-box domain protein [Trypanosoma theileri]
MSRGSTVQELAERVGQPALLTEEELTAWTQASDVSRAGAFYGSDVEAARRCVHLIADVLVTKYLNNPDHAAVPVDNKSRVCLVLGNFALYKPVRDCIFGVLDKLEKVFEESITEDGLLPFRPDLGRMTEHVSVLLVRITGYKLKAANVLEFTDGNTQFSVQLMLAILLKEPPYEMALRCNCISIILGFTQPQAFFDSSKGMEETSCREFTEKINFMLTLMLRLKAVQVLSDVLMEQMEGVEVVPPLLHVATCNSMRCIMNIFRFASTHTTQWRQHVLLSTTLLDHPVMNYLLLQCASLQKMLEGAKPSINVEMVRGMSLGYKFGSFCTFRVDRYARELRPFSLSLHNMLQLSIRPVMHDTVMSTAIMRLYVDMFHFMANIDALGGEEGLPVEDIPAELRSDSLRASVEMFLQREVAPGGLSCVQAWHNALKTVEPDTLVERNSATFALLQKIFNELEAQLLAQQPAAASTPSAPPTTTTTTTSGGASGSDGGKKRFLAEAPPLRMRPQETKVSIEDAAARVESTKPIAVVHREDITGVDPMLLCALTGNVMKNPVMCPCGHTFEHEAILAWLQQSGSICPITGKPLTASALKPNKDVAAMIMKKVIEQSMRGYNQENEADLYDF